MSDDEWILSVARRRLRLRPTALLQLEKCLRGGGPVPFEVVAAAVEDRVQDQFQATSAGASAPAQRGSANLLAAIDRWAGSIPEIPPSDTGPLESGSETQRIQAAHRRTRRLKRFKEMGGKLRAAGTGWHLGPHGAVAALAREEKKAGQPKSGVADVRKELIAAHIAEREGLN